jgi:hypothetical protein
VYTFSGPSVLTEVITRRREGPNYATNRGLKRLSSWKSRRFIKHRVNRFRCVERERENAFRCSYAEPSAKLVSTRWVPDSIHIQGTSYPDRCVLLYSLSDRIPHCLDNRLTDGGRSTPQKHYFSASGTHFCLTLSEPQGLVRQEGLGKLKKFAHLIDLEPATFRLVAKCHNHYVSACPLI